MYVRMLAAVDEAKQAAVWVLPVFQRRYFANLRERRHQVRLFDTLLQLSLASAIVSAMAITTSSSLTLPPLPLSVRI